MFMYLCVCFYVFLCVYVANFVNVCPIGPFYGGLFWLYFSIIIFLIVASVLFFNHRKWLELTAPC